MSGSDKKSFSMVQLREILENDEPADEGHARVINMVKEKLKAMEMLSTAALAALPTAVRNRVAALQNIQIEHDEHEQKMRKEKAELDAKYQSLYRPLYSKRKDIISGNVEPPAAEASRDVPAGAPEKDEEDVVGVPDFWLVAMRNNHVLREQITERDEGALHSLRDISWAPLDKAKGFTLTFEFAPNKHFKNTTLSKTYYMVDEEDPILERATGTKIEWLPGKNVTQKVLKRKLKRGATSSKPLTKIESCQSFFNFFSPPEVPQVDGIIDEDEAEELQELMEDDYEIGSTLKEQIIPHAVRWFTGDAMLDEDDDDDEDDEDDDEEEDEDGDEDDEEDDGKVLDIPKATKQ